MPHLATLWQESVTVTAKASIQQSAPNRSMCWLRAAAANPNPCSLHFARSNGVNMKQQLCSFAPHPHPHHHHHLSESLGPSCTRTLCCFNRHTARQYANSACGCRRCAEIVTCAHFSEKTQQLAQPQEVAEHFSVKSNKRVSNGSRMQTNEIRLAVPSSTFGLASSESQEVRI